MFKYSYTYNYKRLSLSLSRYVYVYIYIHIHTYYCYQGLGVAADGDVVRQAEVPDVDLVEAPAAEELDLGHGAEGIGGCAGLALVSVAK